MKAPMLSDKIFYYSARRMKEMTCGKFLARDVKEFLKRLEKRIDDYSKDKGEWHKYYIKTKDIKQIIKEEAGEII